MSLLNLYVETFQHLFLITLSLLKTFSYKILFPVLFTYIPHLIHILITLNAPVQSPETIMYQFLFPPSLFRTSE